MANQQYGTTGLAGYRRPRYTDQINAQRAFIPQILAQKNQQKQQALENTYRERELGYQDASNKMAAEKYASDLRFQRDEMAFNKDQAKRGTGMEALKLATTMSGNLPRGGMPYVPLVGKQPGGVLGGGNMWDKAKSVGGMIAPGLVGGLAGYGAGAAFGGKNKLKKGLFGAGAGLLTSFLGGNTSMGGLGTGLGAGLLGGLFS